MKRAPINAAGNSAANISTYLFVPGNRPDRFAKACATNAGAVIIDLEDAVAPADKAMARAAVAAWLTPEEPVLIRVNSTDTEWFRQDLQMCHAAGVTGIVLPKAESAADVGTVVTLSGGAITVLPMIESARGLWNVIELARCEGVQRLMFGSIDFQHDVGIDSDDADELLHFRSQLVLASRVAGIAKPVDGVTTAINDPQRLQADAMRAKRLGFGAKCCIHPAQIDLTNRYFEPSQEQLAWAKRVIDATQNAQGGAVAVEGQMVDKPVYARAIAILARQVNQ